MSAAGRGVERIENDAYNTPRWAVWRMLENLYPKAPHHAGRVRYDMAEQTWLDAGAGGGAIIAACDAYFEKVLGVRPPRWIAVEKDARMRKRLEALVGKRNVFIGDYLGYDPGRRKVDMVVKNPPYSIAQEFIEHSLKLSRVVNALTRLNYLESDGRASFMQANTPSALVLPNRPSFAVSLKCNTNKGGCGWAAIFKVGARLPKVCPDCENAKLSKTTTDATGYAWLIWGLLKGPELRILKTTPEAERCE